MKGLTKKGILEKITVQEGQTVEVGAILGSIGASAIQSTENDEVKKRDTKETIPDLYL